MRFDVVIGSVLETLSELAVVGIFEGESLPDTLAGLIDERDVDATPSTTRLVYGRGSVAPDRVLLVGLGTRDDVDAERLRRAVATAVREAMALGVASATFGTLAGLPIDDGTVGEALAIGFELGAYRYQAHKTRLSDDDRREVERMTVVVAEASAEAPLADGLASGATIANGVKLARDLVNRPPESKTPPKLADEAVALAGRVRGVEVTVFDEDRLAAEGFGGILAVGKGSDSPPRFIVMEYGADLADAPTICIVGKGLTFDSGGYNIKPEDGMLNMKNDMGGAAAVFGVVQTVAELGLPVHLVALVPSAENMISGRAYRPGDVVTSLSGTTIEILNTDAEGRVILSDGLFYAQRYEPEAIVEMSTLTGAIIVALGNVATGVMATDQPLADSILAAAEASGDRAWQLPLWDDYREMIKGDVGDIKNLAGRAAGSITAGAFLAEFVGDIPFVHLDIAGTAWLDTPTLPYHARGGTGAGVRLVTEFLRRRTA